MTPAFVAHDRDASKCALVRLRCASCNGAARSMDQVTIQVPSIYFSFSASRCCRCSPVYGSTDDGGGVRGHCPGGIGHIPSCQTASFHAVSICTILRCRLCPTAFQLRCFSPSSLGFIASRGERQAQPSTVEASTASAPHPASSLSRWRPA